MSTDAHHADPWSNDKDAWHGAPWNYHDAPMQTWPERMVLPALLCFAWLLFELTANATLSVLVACVRFGWQDLLTACWLRRVDPHPARAKTGFWFYIASGIWKTALVPVLAVMIVGVAWALFAPRAIRMDAGAAEQVWSALGVGAGASAALVFVVTIGVLHALLGNVRIWVHHDLHRSRRQRVWPPEWPRPVWQHDNRGRAILATALIAITICVPPLLYSYAVHLDHGGEIAAMLALVFGTPIFATLTYASLRSRIFAHRPWQCWPESGDQAAKFFEQTMAAHSAEAR